MTYNDLLQELTREPHIENGSVKKAPSIVVGGMGGSALPAFATRFLDSTIPISTHRDYDLPEGAKTDALYIAISHSGNTAETISFARKAKENNFSLAVITSGGELFDFAKESNVPYVQVPSHIQPRNALFFLLRALLVLLDRSDLLTALSDATFDDASALKEAENLADILEDSLPIYYASRRNGFLAWVSKIHTNETAKMPAIANIFPELNHNEMQAFDMTAPESVSSIARFILLHDDEDDARLIRRMSVFAELMRERDRSVTDISLIGGTRAAKLSRRWYVMHHVAHELATRRGVNPEAVSMIEDFKKRL
ncbi:hypothetical protein MNBD_CPR01-567 [hydrothermal vent metagenome]|uniref:SIS domain-containing protein n=1 Tax=hydrothermal vent metagenome TaxID=652676 RepID=A0A3B0V3K4_9ZZZZ